jgi:hypothetical protein
MWKMILELWYASGLSIVLKGLNVVIGLNGFNRHKISICAEIG